MENFNSKHPEKKENEIFLLNIIPTMFNSYQKSGWDLYKSMRIGKTAYTNMGEKVKDRTPLFATIK